MLIMIWRNENELTLYDLTSCFLLQKEKPLKRKLISSVALFQTKRPYRISLFKLVFIPSPSPQIYQWVILINILNLQKDERSLQAVFLLQIKFSNSFYYDQPWNVSINIK